MLTPSDFPTLCGVVSLPAPSLCPWCFFTGIFSTFFLVVPPSTVCDMPKIAGSEASAAGRGKFCPLGRLCPGRKDPAVCDLLHRCANAHQCDSNTCKLVHSRKSPRYIEGFSYTRDSFMDSKKPGIVCCNGLGIVATTYVKKFYELPLEKDAALPANVKKSALRLFRDRTAAQQGASGGQQVIAGGAPSGNSDKCPASVLEVDVLPAAKKARTADTWRYVHYVTTEEGASRDDDGWWLVHVTTETVDGKSVSVEYHATGETERHIKESEFFQGEGAPPSVIKYADMTVCCQTQVRARCARMSCTSPESYDTAISLAMVESFICPDGKDIHGKVLVPDPPQDNTSSSESSDEAASAVKGTATSRGDEEPQPANQATALSPAVAELPGSAATTIQHSGSIAKTLSATAAPMPTGSRFFSPLRQARGVHSTPAGVTLAAVVLLAIFPLNGQSWSLSGTLPELASHLVGPGTVAPLFRHPVAPPASSLLRPC